MSTTQVAAGLFQLQQLDLELDRIVAEQQAIASSLQANARLQKLRKESEIAQQQLHSGQQAQKEAEWTLEDLSRRLKAQEQRLYSGSVTNPKELQALQQEVQRLRAQHGRQEDATLELMDATEALQETARSRAEASRQAEEDWTRENAAKLARRTQLETRQQELQQQRAQRTTGIDAGLLQRYEAMRRTKQGRAISKVEQNSCQWCRVILTPSELQHVRGSSDLQTCTNCGRILYYARES
ncbi:MAG TPA: C4-type zinc ribbon domain-containing protein [Ktedonobacteraceae bacterium]|nr:C4-type zinc ribbon domain-containing protein [Ktedonobacteraceae bacterium]